MEYTQTLLTNQNWQTIEDDYFRSTPYNFAIIDDFLTPDVAASIRRSILSNKGWGFMNWQAQELFIRNFELPELELLSEALKERLRHVLEGLDLVQHIAFMHQRNVGLCAHSDTGLVTLNLWLTPDQYNLDPNSGGLVLYDVKRTPEMPIHEFNASPWSVQYLQRHTAGGEAKVAYKFNRAVLFDSRTFHASDRLCFDSRSAETYRINYALLFDHVEEFSRRFDQYDVQRALPHRNKGG